MKTEICDFDWETQTLKDSFDSLCAHPFPLRGGFLLHQRAASFHRFADGIGKREFSPDSRSRRAQWNAEETSARPPAVHKRVQRAPLAPIYRDAAAR